MKRTAWVPAAALLCMSFAAALLCGCAAGTPTKTRVPVAPENTLSIRPYDEGVTDFRALLGKTPEMYENDNCFNITPDYIKENSDFLIFKFDQSCASFLQYGDVVYPLGEYLGGTGAESFALADLTGDGVYELYFTFSWGSGMHRSQVGYFDPATKAVTVFDIAFYSEDSMLTLDADGKLQVSHADISYGMEDESFYVSFDLTAEDTLGTFSYNNGKVEFIQTGEKPA